VNGRGERLLLHIGIIDILQSYRCWGEGREGKAEEGGSCI
jgi:hypothetical protein